MNTLRLSDAIVAAHKIACSEKKKEIAQFLLEALELELTRIGGQQEERREKTELEEAAFSLHEETFGPFSPLYLKSTP
jgi:hypothetical protein